VRWVKRDSAGAAIVGCCLLITCLGCCCPRPRHGLILRGDWSLELNRLPWLRGRPNGCEGQATGCEAYPAPPGGVGPRRPEADLPAGGLSETAWGPACGCSVCGVRRGGELAVGGDGQTVPVGYHNHPRFHPVPTQPVFLPRPDRFSMIDGGGPSAVYPTPAPTGADPASIDPAPAPPEPEVIPAPPAGSEGGWKPRDSKRSVAIGGSPSWVFRPGADLRRDPMARTHVPTGRGAGQVFSQ
jgi:hypothetical protein